MSNAVYPSLPGLMFPVGRTVVPPPVQVRTTPSQREYRARDAIVPRYQYSLVYEFLSAGRRGTELATLVGFYNQAGGPFDSWLFQDPDDSAAAGEIFGIGDGTTTTYQLLRAFGGFAEAITDPLVASVGVYTGCFGGTARQNYLIRTAAFANAAWIKNNCTATDAAATAPDGNATASTLSRTAAGNHFALQVFVTAAPANTQATYSVWIKAGTLSGNVALRIRDGAGAFDIAAASFTPSGTWQRCAVSGTFGPTPAPNIQVYIDPENDAGAAGDSLLLWGPQLEVQALSSGTIVNAGGTPYYPIVSSAGVVTFSRPPAAAAPLTWSGSFYRRCRFTTDKLDTQKFMADLFEAKRVEFISTKA